MDATAEVAGEKVEEARQRVSIALKRVKEVAVRASDKAVDYAKVTDQMVREHPYRALGLALGVGALFGVLMSRRSASRNGG